MQRDRGCRDAAMPPSRANLIVLDGVHTWCGHVDARYPSREFAKVSENGEFYLSGR